MRKILVGFITLVFTLPLLFLSTAQVEAHHSIIIGQVACVKIDGQFRQVVTWTITNSESNHTEKITSLSSPVFGIHVNDIIADSASVHGTQLFSGLIVGNKSLTVIGKWSDNVTVTNTGTVHLDGNCVGPTPTPTQEVTPTPTINPCDQQPIVADVVEVATPTPCVTPSVTPEVSPTPEPCTSKCGNPPTFQGSTTEAPAAVTCNIPFDKPKLFGFQLGKAGEATFLWFDIQHVDKFSIIYGKDPNHLIYGVDNIPDDNWWIPVRSITLHGLPSGSSVFAKVGAWRNGCEEESDLLDPVVM